MRAILALSLVSLVLAGCASRMPLEPPPGGNLPVAPHGAKTTPDPDALLTPPPQAVPDRTIELRKRSEERTDDPFDLPPE